MPVPADPLPLLSTGELTLQGRLLTASNATFVGRLEADGLAAGCVYKPVRGERPLWDFPEGTLANRERAAYLVSEATGWALVPPTVLRDGPFGTGMVQLWIDHDGEPESALVDVVPLGEVPEGWLRVFDAEDRHRSAVSLVHADHPALRQMAALDMVMNNADRKGGHVLVNGEGHVYGVDHGVCFHEDPKLRTVLWGWAGERLGADVEAGLERLAGALEGTADSEFRDELAELLSSTEVRALRRRLDRLTRSRRFALPSQQWPSIPWPAF